MEQGQVTAESVFGNKAKLEEYERHNMRMGALTIAWLTSYEGVGDAHASLYPEGNPDEVSAVQILKGRVLERVSQVKVGFFRLASPKPGQPRAKQDAEQFACGLDRQNRYVLQVTLPPGCSKFKIVEVTSC